MTKTVTEPVAGAGALDLEQLVEEGLLAAAVAGVLRSLVDAMDAEVDDLVGPRDAKLGAARQHYRHGSAPGSVVLGARRVPVQRPRVRSTDGAEVGLDTYRWANDRDLIGEAVLRRTLANVALRRQPAVAEPVGAEVLASARSTSPSTLSRHLKRAAVRATQDLCARRFDDLGVVALMIDGVHFADTCCVAVLAICDDGSKVVMGLWAGDTENARVVTDLLADLVDRGLDDSRGLLFVIDGSKALAKGIRSVFGDDALIQRCQLHKRRNVADNLPHKERLAVDRRLARAFANPDPAAGRRAALALAADLEKRWPSAAASLREGLDEMFTVRRLGVEGRLAATLVCTNAIESMFSVVRVFTSNVKRWRGQPMVMRWATLGALKAEGSFRRVKGCTQIPELRIALEARVTARGYKMVKA